MDTPLMELERTTASDGIYAFKEDRWSSHWTMLRLLGQGAGRRALDVGAADGFLAQRLTQQGWRVTAIEGQETLAARARGRCEELILADLNESVPVLPGSFDAIICGDVLEHLLSPERVLRSLSASLAPAGQVVVSIPNVAHLSVRLMLLCGRFEYAQRGILDRTHVHFYTRRSFRALLAACGLRPERIIAVPAPLALALPPRFHGPWLDALQRLHALGARCWPGGLAYQFVAVARREA